MIVDAQLQFSSAQAIASAASTNVLDLGAPPQNFVNGSFVSERRIGSGRPMAVIIVVTTALDAADGDETYTAKVQSDDAAAFGSPTDVTPAYSLPRGSAAGTIFVIPIPPRVATERFLRLLYAVGGTTPSGNVTAFLVGHDEIPKEAVYPQNIKVSI